MSDHVIFATSEHATDSTRRSGFNGFNFSTDLDSIDEVPAVVSPSGFPAVTPIDWLAKMYWRIKSVKISGELSYTRFYQPSGRVRNTGSFSFSDEICVLGAGAESESSIVALPFRRWANVEPGLRSVLIGEDTFYFDSPTPPPPITEDIFIGSFAVDLNQWYGRGSYGLLGISRFVKLPTDELLHNVVITLGVASNSSGPPFLSTWTGREFGWAGSAIPLDLFGVTIPMLPANMRAGDLAAGSLTIEAHEWWPYAVQPTLPDGSPHPNAGLPVWDTATGAQLRDPVTGF